MPEPPDEDRMPRYEEIFGAGREVHDQWRAFLRTDARMKDDQERRLRWRDCLLHPTLYVRHQAHETWVRTLRYVPDHPVLGRQASLDNGVLEIVRSEQDPPFDVMGLFIRVLLGDETGIAEARSQLETAKGIRKGALERCLRYSDEASADQPLLDRSYHLLLIPPYELPGPPRPPRPRPIALEDLTPFRLYSFAEHAKVLGEHPKVVCLLKAPGDRIGKGEAILELETDLAIIEVVAPSSGRIRKWTVQVGDEVEAGTLLCWILNPSASDTVK